MILPKPGKSALGTRLRISALAFHIYFYQRTTQRNNNKSSLQSSKYARSQSTSFKSADNKFKSFIFLKSFVIASPVFISRTSIFGFLHRGYPYHQQCGYRDTLNKGMTVGRIIISSSNLGSFAPSSPAEPASHVQYSAFVSEFVQVVKV